MTMDGDNMRRGKNFFRRNQYKIAGLCAAIAILGFAGIFMMPGDPSGKEKKQQTAKEQTGQTVRQQQQAAEKNTPLQKEKKEETAKASAVIHPRKEDVIRWSSAEPIEPQAQAQAEPTAQQEEPAEAAETAETLETANMNNAASAELHFDASAGLLWPVSGAVILDYSMDKTIYFTTLDQYKYNPAVIISGNVNDPVQAAANGRITDISTNEVTGCTVTMDLGDGYTAIYGQLKEVPYEAGAYVEAGDSLGFVNEPTKYYSLEGSNLYFALEKDGKPVNPVEFFQ